jgi:NitT/TauT family transport system substrate-binding protein
MRGKFYRSVVLVATVALGLSVAGCVENVVPTPTGPLPVEATATPGTTQPTPTTASVQPTTPAGDLQKVTIALGYIPDVQFAPFYVALNKGYYQAEGLDVTLQNGIVQDLIGQLGVGAGDVNFAVVSGDEVIPARVQGIPVKYVMTWYRQYPVAAISIEGKGPTLTSPADLKGRKVGVPGPFGSTYVGLQALLKSAGLTLDDIQLESIGFTQVPSLISGQVDVAMGYAANEPVQLSSQGVNVSTLKVADYMKLASNGLVTNDKTYKENPELVGKVVRATLKGLSDTIADPAAAFESSLKQVPEAANTRDLQMRVLQESIKLMQPNPVDPTAKAPPPPGFTEENVWQATQDFLYDAKIIDKKGTISDMFTNEFVQPGMNQ